LQHWIDSPLGTHPRASITRTQILAQLATWETAGVAASSINHRLLELRALYRELDAEDAAAYNPTLDIRKRREPEPAPRAVPYDLIEAIIAYMPDRGRQLTAGASRPTASQSKARARVMAWTGLPPAQVMKIQPTTSTGRRRH
jgi:site-specific recombinase XerD